ncbi:MAG TPA: RDD family protein [Burkholderiales bacterium]|nr:RDD family protein [Burkholderiales bacterium]
MPSNPYSAPTATVADVQITGQQNFGYAGFWRRFLAVLLDSLILAIPFRIFIAGMESWHGSAERLNPLENASDATDIAINVVVIAVSWLYFALMESSKQGATLGKWILGMRVTDEAGNQISFGRATGRYFGKMISSLILGIGYLMQPFTKRKQTLHDLMAGCVVIRTRA